MRPQRYFVQRDLQAFRVPYLRHFYSVCSFIFKIFYRYKKTQRPSLRTRYYFSCPLCMSAVLIALGAGYESRRPLGLVIIGSLLVSQLVTLFLTSAIYLHFEARREGAKRKKRGGFCPQ